MTSSSGHVIALDQSGARKVPQMGPPYYFQFSWIGFNVNVNEDSETNPQRINVICDSVCIVFFFAVPLIAMIFCYVRIFAVLRQQLHAIKQNNTLSTTREERLSYRRKRRAALIFIGMITMYIICWFPYFLLNFQREFGNEFFALSILVEYIVFYYPKFLNSLLNPLLYVFCKHDFRQAIGKIRRKTQEKSVSFSLQNTLGKLNSPAPSSLVLRTFRSHEQATSRDGSFSVNNLQL